MNTTRRISILLAAAALLAACAGGFGSSPAVGLLVRAEAEPGALPKEGVIGIADNGAQLFAHARLRGTVSAEASGGAHLPRWVQVSWREGAFEQDFKTAGWVGGTLVGNYRVEVAARVPPEVIQQARQKDHALHLIFRLKDDGVLLAWDVLEWKHSNGINAFIYSLHGGDF